MLTEDYIMRMINQALAVFLAALGLKKAGQYHQAQQSFDQAMEGLLGLRADLVNQLEDRQLLDLLTFRDRLDIERLLLLADIYHEKGEVYALQGQPGESTLAAQRSLRLYLEAALAGDTNLTIELVRKIEAQRNGLSTPDLPAETRLALMDYFDRMLTSRDDFLVEVGLTRGELQEEMDALDSGEV